MDGLRIAQARQALRPDGLPRQSEQEPAMTQQDLADFCRVHRVTLTKIENGQARVSREVLERLALVLGRSRKWLLGGADPGDDLEIARERVASALSKMGEGFEDFSAAVDALYARIGAKAPVAP